MCERFTQHYTWKEIHDLYGLTAPRPPTNLSPQYKICPAATINTLRLVAGKPVFEPMRWGFIPAWWLLGTEPKHPATFNAPVESVATAPFFRSAFKRKRCLIPVSGYYEWRETRRGRQPYYFTRRNGSVISIAGLWDEWRNPDTGELTRSCTMIVGEPNRFVAEVRDRMPVILERRQFKSWLSGEAGVKLLKPAGEEVLNKHPVSKRVNKAPSGDADETLIEEVTLTVGIPRYSAKKNAVSNPRHEVV
jgi:putative SOS response-associated peptidase YedK